MLMKERVKMNKIEKKKKLLMLGTMMALMTTSCGNKKQVNSIQVESKYNNVIESSSKIKVTNKNEKEQIADEMQTLEIKKEIFKTDKAIVKENCNMYFGPSNEYDVITNIAKDNKVTLISKSFNNWFIASYKDNYGFIDGNNLNLENSIIPEDYMPFKRFNVVQAICDVNIRSNPKIDSEKLGLLNEGNQVELLSDMENGWYKVKYNDEIGYINKDYVFENINDKLVNNYYKVICLKQDADLLNEDKIKMIELPKYECGKVYNETENYYIIETDNTIGYIKKDNLLELEGRFVIVDISNQQLELYENNEVTFTSDVVTGRPHHETDMGIESVQFKQKNRTLRGRGYSSFVKYWMRINGNAEGLHDASWRSEFGGEIYKTNGSHGCVNLPTESAEFLYDTLEVGDRVIVKR